jgi:hypothetical protein
MLEGMSNQKKVTGGRYTPKAKLGGEWVPMGTPGSSAAQSPLVRREIQRGQALSALALMVDDRALLEAQIKDAVDQARAFGATQAEVAGVLGVTQSAVSKRYRPGRAS